LLQIAPHLVTSLPCLIPFYGQGLLAQTRLRASLALTDALGFDKSLPLHQLLSAAQAREREPSLRAEGLTGAALVWEAQVPHAERLALALALDAEAHGAVLHTHTQVVALRRRAGPKGGERVGGVLWTDRLSGETGDTAAQLVIQASGAWLPELDPALTALRGVPGMRRKCVTVAAAPLHGGRDALLLFPGDAEGSGGNSLPPGKTWRLCCTPCARSCRRPIGGSPPWHWPECASRRRFPAPPPCRIRICHWLLTMLPGVASSRAWSRRRAAAFCPAAVRRRP